MGRKEKLLQKAIENPKNLRFTELCSLAEYFGMGKRQNASSHVVYKRSERPFFSQSIQNVNGFAKQYQVRQLLRQLRQHQLIDNETEE